MDFIKNLFKNEKFKNITMVVLSLITMTSVCVAVAVVWNFDSENKDKDAWTPTISFNETNDNNDDTETEEQNTQNNTDNENNPPDNQQLTPDTPKNSTTNPVIIIWDYPDNRMINNAIAEFKKKNKNIEFKVEHGGLPTKQHLEDEIAAGRGPDIIYVDQVYSVSMGEQNLLKDLSQFNVKNISNKFVQSAVDSISFGNKQYGIPFSSNTITMMYNKKAFKDANVKIPTTYNEIVNADKKLKGKFGISYTTYTAPFYKQEHKNWLTFNYFHYLWRMGGDILSKDLKSAAFNSKSGVEALEMIIDMKNKGIIDTNYREEEFFNGQVGIIDNGSWNMNNVIGKDKKADIGIAMLPTLKKGVKPYSGLGLNCYAVTETSKNAKTAYEFIEFYTTSPRYQADFCKSNNLIPTLKEAQNDKFYKTPEWKIMIEQLETSKYRPSVPNWEEIENIIANAIIMALNGDMKPKEALDAAASKVNKELKTGNN